MRDAPLGRVERVDGAAGAIRVTFTNLSFRQTSKGRRWPYGEFGPDLLYALHDRLTSPRRRGVFRSALVCPSCDAMLDGSASEAVTVAVKLQLPAIPPLGIEVQMPGIRCPGCGRSLVRLDDRNVESDLSDALIAALRSAGIEPG